MDFVSWNPPRSRAALDPDVARGVPEALAGHFQDAGLALPGRSQETHGLAADEIAGVLAGHADEMLDGLGAAELTQGPDRLEADVVGIVLERRQDLGDDGLVPDLPQDLQGAAAAPGRASDLAQGLGGRLLDIGQSLLDELLEAGPRPGGPRARRGP